MTSRPYDASDLQALTAWDTPTICNALDLVAPERRGLGFTVDPVVAVNARQGAVVGLARVGTLRAKEPPRGAVAERLEWYDYVGDSELPTMVVLQDVDDRPGHGAFWGEVNSAVHRSLGAAGCVTNGTIRDLEAFPPDFAMLGGRVGPSHAHVHIVDFGRPVNVLGMQVGHDDVVHADYHGAVVVPAEAVKALPAAVGVVMRREKVILDLCRSETFSREKLRDAIRRSREIH